MKLSLLKALQKLESHPNPDVVLAEAAACKHIKGMTPFPEGGAPHSIKAWASEEEKLTREARTSLRARQRKERQQRRFQKPV